MPRMLSISSVACAGMSLVAARSSAALYEPRRRLPEIPSTLVMKPPWSSLHGACRACNPQARCLFLEFRGHPLVGLAERDARGDHQPVGLLGGVDGRIEADGGAV